MPAFGYNTLLDVQPAIVDMGFCIFLTVSTSIVFFTGSRFIVAVSMHGKRLQKIKETLKQKKETISN